MKQEDELIFFTDDIRVYREAELEVEERLQT